MTSTAIVVLTDRQLAHAVRAVRAQKWRGRDTAPDHLSPGQHARRPPASSASAPPPMMAKRRPGRTRCTFSRICNPRALNTPGSVAPANGYGKSVEPVATMTASGAETRCRAVLDHEQFETGEAAGNDRVGANTRPRRQARRRSGAPHELAGASAAAPAATSPAARDSAVARPVRLARRTPSPRRRQPRRLRRGGQSRRTTRPTTTIDGVMCSRSPTSLRRRLAEPMLGPHVAVPSATGVTAGRARSATPSTTTRQSVQRPTMQ